jgi:prepilin-type processing-associated H-X9-DG protein
MHGLNFAPSGGATLNVSDSIFYNNGGSGIIVRPTGSGYANVHIRNTKFERNANGLFVDGSASSIGINVNISESLAVENQGNGIGAFTSAGGASVTVSVIGSHISGNITNGIGALGATASGAGSAVIAVGSSMITANVNGVATGAAGQIRTYGNNQLLSNSNNGVFTSNVGLQ